MISESLTDRGIVIVNLISAFEGEGSLFLQAEYETYAKIFPHIYLFKPNTEKPASAAQNVILAAVKNEPEYSKKTEIISELLANQYFKKPDSTVQILTDDLAPVELYNSLAQKYAMKK